MSVRRSLRSGHSSRLSLNETLLGRRRQHFKWTSDLYMKMAKYLSEHYDLYSVSMSKAALQQGKRKQFLRTMKTRIGGLESLHDEQIDRGFNQLLIKYNFVKAKVNSGGVQPYGTAYKEEILEQCPYFYILDATFAKTPKDIIYEPETDDIGNEVTNENDEESSSEDSIVLIDHGAQPKIEIDPVELEEDKKSSESQLVTPVSPPNYLDLDLKTRSPSVASRVKAEEDNEYVELVYPSSPPNSVDCDLKTHSPSVASDVNSALKDIGVGKGVAKSSITTLVEPINNKVQDQLEVEKQKLKLEERKLVHAIEIKKLDIEYLKVKTQPECQRFAMEKAKNELEFQKFKVQQENELKKLQLQIELEKLKRSSRKPAEDD